VISVQPLPHTFFGENFVEKIMVMYAMSAGNTRCQNREIP